MTPPPEPKYITMSEHEVKKLIITTVNATLTQLGIEHDDPLEMQRDFQHLRDWRKSTERIKSRTMLSAVGLVVAAVMAALWMGIKSLLME